MVLYWFVKNEMIGGTEIFLIRMETILKQLRIITVFVIRFMQSKSGNDVFVKPILIKDL